MVERHAPEEIAMTTDEQLARAFDLRGTSTSTRDVYTRYIHRFEQFCGRPASELGRADVERYLLHLVHDTRLSPSSHNVYAGALRFLYDVVLDRPEVVARMPRRKQPMRLPVLLSPAQVASLISAARSLAVRTILMLMYGAGLRVSEACTLRVEDIDSRSMVLHIRHAKRGRERYVMLSPRLLAALRDYWRQRRPAGAYLFPGRLGSPTRTGRGVARALRLAARRIGFDERIVTSARPSRGSAGGPRQALTAACASRAWWPCAYPRRRMDASSSLQGRLFASDHWSRSSSGARG